MTTPEIHHSLVGLAGLKEESQGISHDGDSTDNGDGLVVEVEETPDGQVTNVVTVNNGVVRDL